LILNNAAEKPEYLQIHRNAEIILSFTFIFRLSRTFEI